MPRRNWHGRMSLGFPQARSSTIVPALLLLLAGLGLVNKGWQAARHLWQELHRPTAVYHHAISNGLAISLNGLEQRREREALLPGVDIRGVMYDRSQNDWILFGEAAPERPGVPLDTVAVALRAIRLHLEAPGIDIRPQQGSAGAQQDVQTVSYFGGLARTVVGRWFFLFDHWMKRAALADVAVPGRPVYWHRLVEELEREVREYTLTSPTQWTRRSRFWLCAGDFVGIEGDDTLAFEQTPLQVLAERLPTAGEEAGSATSPCTSPGIDDRLAAEFAHWLTTHLDELASVLHVAEITTFARLLAGLTWLTEQDPYRDLRPWLQGPLLPHETPPTVPTLARQAERTSRRMQGGALRLLHHRLKLSGGVLVAPTLRRMRVRDDSLRLLHRAILEARPIRMAVVWRFTFKPPAI